MSNTETVNPKSPSDQSKTENAQQAKPKFSSYLRAVNTERLNPANNQDKTLMLSRPIPAASPTNYNAQLLQATGVLISMIWLVGAALYVQRTVGWNNVSSLMPHELGGFLAGILTPIALFWMIAAFIMRSNDVKMYSEALREEIQRMIFPSEEADRRVNNDIERLMRQTAEMSKATKYALTALDAARDAVKGQVLALNGSSEDTLDRLSNLSNNLKERTKDVVSVREQLDQTLNQLDGRAQVTNHIVDKLSAATSSVKEQTNAVDQATKNTENAVIRMAAMLRERLESLGSIHGETETALQQAAEELKRQREGLHVDAEAIEEKSYVIAETLEKGLGKLYAYTDDALDKAKIIETRLQGQTSSIEHVLTQANMAAEAIQQSTVAATTQLEQATGHTTESAQRIQDVIQDAILRLQQSAAATVAESEKGAQAWIARLGSGVEQIKQGAQQASEQTQESLTQFTGKIAEELERVGTQTQHVIERAKETMGSFSGHVAEDLNRIEEHTKQAVEQTRQSLTQLGHVIVENIGQVDERSKQIVERTQASMNSFTNALTNNLGHVEERAKQAVQETENSLGQFSRTIVQNIDQVDARARRTVEDVQTGLTDATGRLVSEVDGISERAKSVTNDMLTEVNRKVADTTAAFVYIQKQIQALVTAFDQRKLHLDEAGTGARETADALQKTLQAALDKVQGTTRALQDGITNIQKAVESPIRSLETAVQQASVKAVDMTNLIDSKAVVLTEAAHKIGQDVVTLHDQLHGKGQDVALLAGKIATHLKTVTEQIDTQHDVLDKNLQQSVQQLHDMSAMQKQVNAGLESIQEQTGRVADHVTTLQQTHQALAKDAQESEGRLASVSDRLVSISGNTVENIKQTLENLTLLEADYHRLTEASVDDINRIETGYRKSLTRVEEETQTIADKMAAIYQAIQAQSEEANQRLETQSSRMEQSSGALEGLSRVVIGAMDNALTKASRVQEIGNHVQITLDSIGATSNAFNTRIAESVHHADEQAQNIQNLMDALEDKARGTVSSFIQQGKALEDQTKEQLLSITDNIEKTSAVTDHLRKYLDFVRTQSREVEEDVSATVSRLTDKGSEIEAQATQWVETLGRVHDRLVAQATEVNSYGDGMLERLETALTDINAKAKALEEAANTAQTQADALRAQESRLKREAFFNSTKFVVESLHSLALDFTRMLDGELPEKTWNAYQKGDASSFTRRLLNVRNEETKDKIKNKFSDDAEFRTYAQRYLRQFEEIFDQAERNDHADLLTSIFLSSDVGKLYKFLCNALERDSRGSASAKVAA